MKRADAAPSTSRFQSGSAGGTARAAALHQHVGGARRETMLARVVGERHAWVALDSLELPAEAEGGGKRDLPLVSIAQPHRSHSRHYRAACRGEVGERGGHVTAEDLIDLVGPGHGHHANLTVVRQAALRHTGVAAEGGAFEAAQE